MQNNNQIDVSSNLVNELLKEKRADRRWKTIRSILWLILITYSVFNIFHYASGTMTTSDKTDKKYSSLIRIDGMIAPGRSFSAEELIPNLRKAFADKHSEGVVIDINSPGGTPVQSAIIHDAIVTFKNKYHKKVIVVGEDLLTSGAYYVAVAADKIYVNPNTITGSVGVIMKGFGFVDALQKIGVERRVYTAGTNKDRLDPFLPQNPEDIQKIDSVMQEVHQNFVNAVLEGRKGKLHGTPEELFSGDFWSGQTALKLGLVDGLGNLMDVTEKEFGTTEYKAYGETSNFLKIFRDEMTNSFDKLAYL